MTDVELSVDRISNARRSKSETSGLPTPSRIGHTCVANLQRKNRRGRKKPTRCVENPVTLIFPTQSPRKLALLSAAPFLEIGYAVRSESWHPGHLHPNLSWTHSVVGGSGMQFWNLAFPFMGHKKGGELLTSLT